MSLVLVTGGTGFLGSHLVPMLRERGHRVRLVGRTSPPPGWLAGDSPVEFLRGDLHDRQVVRQALHGVEVLYHLAGLVSFKPKDGRAMYTLHVDATRLLLEDVKALGLRPRIILASTSGTTAVSRTERVGSEADDAPIDVVGRWPYYLSKIYQERLAVEVCRKAGLPLVVLNPSLLLGPGDERLSSTWTVVKFLQGDIPTMPGGGMSFVDVRDVASAAVAALTRGELYGRHLMGVNMTMSEFFGRLERLSGVGAPKVTLPRELAVLGAHALERVARWRGTTAALDPQEVEIGEHYFWCSSSKAQSLLGFQARDPYETLHDTVKDIVEKMPPQSRPGLKGKLAREARD